MSVAIFVYGWELFPEDVDKLKEKYLNILKQSDLKITEPKLYFVAVDYS